MTENKLNTESKVDEISVKIKNLLLKIREEAKGNTEILKKIEVAELVYLCALDVSKNPKDVIKAIDRLVFNIKKIRGQQVTDFPEGGISGSSELDLFEKENVISGNSTGIVELKRYSEILMSKKTGEIKRN